MTNPRCPCVACGKPMIWLSSTLAHCNNPECWRLSLCVSYANPKQDTEEQKDAARHMHDCIKEGLSLLGKLTNDKG